MVPIRKGGIKSVGAGASSVTITFASDDEYASTPSSFPAGATIVVTGLPDWATSVRISTAADVDSVVITFGTAADAVYGGSFSWEAQGIKLT